MNSYFLKTLARYAILWAMLLASGPLLAQQKATYSLTELIDSAQKHLPVLLQKQAMVNSTKAAITEARNSFLPKLTVGDELSIGAANDLTGTYLPIGGIIHATSGGINAENNLKPQTGNIASAFAEYDLVNFGLRGARVGNAVATADLQQADLNKELYMLKLQLSKLYFNILKNTYQLHIDQENIRRYQSVMTIVNALSGSGIKPGVDSSMARAELSKVQMSFNTHEGAVRKLHQQLSFLTGIQASQINLDTSRKENEFAAGPLLGSVNDTISNPLISYYRKQQLLYKSAEKLVRKSYLPKIILAGGAWERGSSIQNANYQSLGVGLGYQRFTYGGGVAVTYDLFNVVHRRNKLSVSHFQTQAAEFQLEQQKQAISSAMAEAQIAVSTAEKNLHELPEQLKAAQAVYSQKMAQYKAGVIDLIDLTNASFLLYTSQLAYADTLNEWYQANLDKAAATGNLDQFIQTIKR